MLLFYFKSWQLLFLNHFWELVVGILVLLTVRAKSCLNCIILKTPFKFQFIECFTIKAIWDTQYPSLFQLLKLNSSSFQSNCEPKWTSSSRRETSFFNIQSSADSSSYISVWMQVQDVCTHHIIISLWFCWSFLARVACTTKPSSLFLLPVSFEDTSV